MVLLVLTNLLAKISNLNSIKKVNRSRDMMVKYLNPDLTLLVNLKVIVSVIVF